MKSSTNFLEMAKTISERATIAGQAYQFGKTDIESDAKVYERGYIQGATEQQKIDDEELQKVKELYHTVAYEFGYRKAYEKACAWMRENLTRYAAIKQPMNKIIEDFMNNN